MSVGRKFFSVGCTQNLLARHLSLGNPMFVNRPSHVPVTNIVDVKDEPDDADFLTNHGGKIALVGFSLAASLIYRWFIGGKNRTDLEEQIAQDSPLHPYESNDLRVRNSMSRNEFSDFSMKCHKKFKDGYATYDDFVLFFRKHVLGTVTDGYVLDRIVLNFIARSSSSGVQGKYPVDFYLVVLSNIVDASPDERASLLFDIATKATLASDSPKDRHMRSDAPSEKDSMPASGLYCDRSRVEIIVGFMMDAYQVPYEKMIKESGVYIPFKLFKRKTASDMVSAGIASIKPPPSEIGQLSVDEFTEILMSSSVCAWGECYRS